MNTKLRHISYCLIASLLLVACRKESHPITPDEPQEQYAISLSASSSAMTTSRAIVDSESALQNTTLGVFAYKQLADGTKVSVFDNTEVSYDDDNEVWTYTGTKYWDRTAHYYFVSYSPRQDENINFSDAGRLEINKIPNWQEINGGETDYIVANHNGKAEGGYITPNGVRAVPLDFKHILCQLEVRVAKNAFLSSEYTLSGISYTNVPLMGGSANYTCLLPGKDANGGVREEAEGDMALLDEAGISRIEQQMAQLSNVTVPSDPDENKSTTIKHLVVPFNTNTAENIKITLDYKVNGQERDDAVVDTQLKELTENKRYVLTLTFNSGADIKTSLKILDWEDEEVDEDKYNW